MSGTEINWAREIADERRRDRICDLERDLAAMTAELAAAKANTERVCVERATNQRWSDVHRVRYENAERERIDTRAERDALKAELAAMTAERDRFASLSEGLHRQLNEMTAAKELTERQVKILAGPPVVE